MVKVTVWCLPKMEEKELEALFDEIFEALKHAWLITLVQTEKDELILFPADNMSYGLGQEILAEVAGMPIVTMDATEAESSREQLARQIGRILTNRFPSANVECRVHPHDPYVKIWRG